jgi:hypothetical protein
VIGVPPLDPHLYHEFGIEVAVVGGPLQGARQTYRWETV